VSQTLTPFSPQASLEELLALARSKFPCDFDHLKIGQADLDILQLTDMDAYIDSLTEKAAQDEGLQLPFWARIWPTSILLGHSLQNAPHPKSTPLLEIGAGVGLCGLIAAQLGFSVTITDNNEDALLFSRINILKNNLEHKARIGYVDFTSTSLEQRYPLIVGSEVLYHEETYRPLLKFLLKHIQPSADAEVVLAKSYKLKARRFFSMAGRDFDIQEKVIGYKEAQSGNDAQSERHLAQIFRMKPKKHA
jgi:2-polyprenyl-3-methyl-5-hydroxy-6-metoxy-1,4-benzoquinol methylase